VIRPAHVCLLTSSHPVTYSRFLNRQAVSLARAGYRVTLIGLGGVKSDSGSSCGVELVPLAERRLVSKLSVLRDITRTLCIVKPHVCGCLDPWTLSVGLAFSRSRPEVSVVYDASEWFSRAFLERRDLPLPIRAAGYFAIESIEYQASRHADAILDTNATRAERFLRRGCDVTLVPNFPPLELLPPPVVNRAKEVVFTGLASRHRGFDLLLAALARVSHCVAGVRLSVMGEFDPRDDMRTGCEEFVRNHGLGDSVSLHGWVPYGEMLRRAASGIVGVILLQPHRRNDYTGLPNKLFEFMGCGLAVVAADTPEMRHVVTKVGCGWLVDPTNPDAIARVLVEALSDPDECIRRGLAGRAAVFDRYNWGVAEVDFLRCYRRLLE